MVTRATGWAPSAAGTLTAVDDVSFDVAPGEVVSLIGESGSGKTTIGRMVLRLTRVTRGTITLDGADVAALPGATGVLPQVQGVFQDPFSCYNPIFKADRVLRMIKDEFFPGVAAAEWDAKIEAVPRRRCGSIPAQVLGKYPHQLSGGQLQRLLIARALLLDIRFLVADEITSMLDASTRIDVLNLLADLKARGLGVLFVTHDLSLGNYISERAVVMRRGEMVEMGPTDKVFGNPQHPYSRTLVAAVPRLHQRWRDLDVEADATVRARSSPARVRATSPRPPRWTEPEARSWSPPGWSRSRPTTSSPASAGPGHGCAT